MNELSDQLNAALAGRYEIERELGRGGMATVFRARDLKHQRVIALKVLDPELAPALGPERFLREIRIAARMQHPHIVPLFDSGHADGLLFYVMPCLEGGSLRARLEREKQLPVEDAIRIASEVADALDHAHSPDHAHGKEIVHRDVKPENVLFDDDRAMVTDFGIARAVKEAGGEKLTGTGVVIGTAQYMSPEQAAGGAVGTRSDQYALACVVYEMLAGQPPFTGPTAESIAYQHLAVAPPPVTNFRPTVNPALVKVLEHGLAKSPADRYASVGRFAAALREAAEAKEGTRWRRWAVVAATVVAAVIAMVAVKQPWDSLPTPAKPEWVLLADFEGPADEPGLADDVRALVQIDMDRSRILRSVDEEQVRMALALAQKPESTHVSEEVARELALRNGIGTVLSGRVVRIGGGCAILLRMIRAEGGELIASLRRSAADDDAIIPVVGDLNMELLRSLKGKQNVMGPEFSPLRAVTPSFAAFQKYHRSLKLTRAVRPAEALEAAREAVELDPDFALAWWMMGIAHWNLGRTDSASYAIRGAAKHETRLVGAARHLVAADIAELNGDVRGSLRAYDQLLESDPHNPYARTNRGNLLMTLGRLEEALLDFRMAAETEPVAPPPQMLLNESEVLIRLDRLDEVAALTEQLPSQLRGANDLRVALASERWARLDSLCTMLQRDLPAGAFWSGWIPVFRAAALAVRGSIGSALAALEEDFARAERPTQNDTPVTHAVARERILLIALSGRSGTDVRGGPIDGNDHSNLVTRGMTLAAQGDVAGARLVLTKLQADFRDSWRHTGATPELLGAWIERSAKDWNGVVRILGPLARRGGEVAIDERDMAGKPMMRWLVAEALERLGQRDSAAVYYELALDRSPPMHPIEWHQRAVLFSFLHQRLAVLHAKLGHLGEAERHLEILERDFTEPDPDVRHLLDEARVAVAGARRRQRQSGAVGLVPSGGRFGPPRVCAWGGSSA